MSAYHAQGWSRARLAAYYNPDSVAAEVHVFAYGDRDWRLSDAVIVEGYKTHSDLRRKCLTFRPDVVRCYEAFRPGSDDALALAGELRVPSYLSLHDMRVEYHENLAGYTVVTAYTDTLARRAARDLGRDVETQLNGIDETLFSPRCSPAIDERVANATHRIFTIGRRDPVKNIGTAVEATTILAGLVRDVVHVVGGPGTGDLAWDGVHLGLGSIPQAVVVDYLSWCTCFLQPQLVTDIGMAAAEALMVGRPVVATGSPGGNATSLIDDPRGVLIPLREATDPHAVADALRIVAAKEYDYDAIRMWAKSVYSAERLRALEGDRYRRIVGNAPAAGRGAPQT